MGSDFRGRFLYRDSANRFEWSTGGSSTVRMQLDASGNMQTTGNILAGGTLSSNGTKSFDISNAHRGGSWRLRHRCIEAEKALNVYRFQQTLSAGETRQALPAYHTWLNANFQVWVSAYKHFGMGWGDVEEVDGVVYLVANVNQAGQYNILVVADRNDQVAIDEYNEYGVEYEQVDNDVQTVENNI